MLDRGKFREAVVNYRHLSTRIEAMEEKERTSELSDKLERAVFSVVMQFLGLLVTTKLPSEAQEQLLARFRKVDIIAPTDTIMATYDFLAFEIAYAPFVCQLLDLPSRNEEDGIQKGNDHATDK